MEPGLSPATRSEDDRRVLMVWATACASRVLPVFEEGRPGDTRPREAIEGGLAWVQGETTIGPTRELAVAAHAAARDADNPGAIAAARSAGHAAAVAHMAGHAPNAARYALKAIDAARPDAVAAEDAWQRSSVPEHLAAFVYPEDNR